MLAHAYSTKSVCSYLSQIVCFGEILRWNVEHGNESWAYTPYDLYVLYYNMGEYGSNASQNLHLKGNIQYSVQFMGSE